MVEKKSNENPSSCLQKQQLSSSVRNKKDMLECCEHFFFASPFFLPTQLNHFQRRSVSLPSSPSSLPFLHRGRGTEERRKEKRRKEGNGGRRRRFVPSPVWDLPNKELKSLIKLTQTTSLKAKKIPPIFSLVISCPQVIDTTLFPPPGLQQLRRLRRKRRLLL